MDYVSVGKLISKKRRQKKITKKKLAEILDVKKECITYWEKGKCLPYLDKMQQLTNVLDISTNDLMGDDTYLLRTNKTLRNAYIVMILGVLNIVLYNSPVFSLFFMLSLIISTALLFKEIKSLYN